MAKIIFGINEELRRKFEGEEIVGNYNSSVDLMAELHKRGHDIELVHPSDLSINKTTVFTDALYSFDPSNENPLTRKGGYQPLVGNFYFMRSMGEDKGDQSIPKHYLEEIVPAIEEQIPYMITSAQSHKYRDKGAQRELDLPFIPEFNNINSRDDLESKLASGVEVIAKPRFGFLGRGVEYIGSSEDIEKIPEPEISEMIYEQYIPEQIERRYIILGDEIVLMREIDRVGEPAREKMGHRRLNTNPDPKELEIVQSVMDQTGLTFGCVDFRGGYILEINGPGVATSTSNPGEGKLYDIKHLVADYVEQKLRGE